MTKTELVQAVQKKMEITKKDAALCVESVFAALSEALEAGEKVTISGFGSFEVRQRSEKKCKNPRTGTDLVVPASKAPTFRASKVLKEMVNKK